ncbi:ferroxidase fet3 [Pseudogymnoascus australis]
MAPSHSYIYILSLSLAIFSLLADAKVVTYDFNITWVRANPDGQFERATIGINNAWPLPIIEADVGDTVIVNVENGLGNATTSLHFHGLFQNGTTEMDGAIGVTQCGIIDQPGTYWYHSHFRGQYPDGIRAPLIISDPKSPFKDMYDEEFVLSVSDWYHDQMTDLIPKFLNKANPTGAEPVPDSALFNDTQDLEVKIEPGKTYLFRMVNIGAFAGQRVWFEGHTIRIVEVDGIYTDPYEADMIYLTAAQRCSFLLTAKNETSANYAFVGSMDTAKDLFDAFPDTLNYNVTGWLVYDKNKPLPEAKLIDEFTDIDDFLLGKQTKPSHSTAFFNNITYTHPKIPTLYTALTSGTTATNPTIYGQYTHPFVLTHHQTIDLIINNNDPGKHPFHLHGHAFQAIWRSAEDAGPFDATRDTAFPPIPMRRDTLMVRPNGNMVLRFRADNPGVWLFHCHIEWHVDSGLIATIVEAPLEMQKSISVPDDHFDACKAAGMGVRGNAAGNTEDLLDLRGRISLRGGFLMGMFTAKGIVAMTFSIVSALLGLAFIAWYGLADMGAAEKENERRRVAGSGVVEGSRSASE